METRSGRSFYYGQQWLMLRLEKIGLYFGDKGPAEDGACHGAACAATKAILSSRLDHFDESFKLIHQIPLNIFNRTSVIKRWGQVSWRNIRRLLGQVSIYQYENKFDETLGDISLINKHCGVYTQRELQAYFANFSKIIDQTNTLYGKPIALKINSTDHAICIGYDSKLQQWSFIDVNQLPSKRITNPAELAELIPRALFADDDAMFTTHIYCNNSDKIFFEEAVHQWTSEPSWQRMHIVSPKKAKIRDLANANLLILTLMQGDTNNAKLLIKNGADVNAHENFSGGFPLYIAAEGGYTDVIQMLCENGVDFNLRDFRGDTAFCKAVINGQLEVIKVLLKHGDNINQVNEYGITPLHLSVSRNKEIMRFLLDNGANPSARAKNKNFTPLYFAILHNDIEAVKLLLEYNATTTTRVTITKEEWLRLTRRNPFVEEELLNKKNRSANITLTLEEYANLLGNNEIAKLLRNHREQRTMFFRSTRTVTNLKRERNESMQEESVTKRARIDKH